MNVGINGWSGMNVGLNGWIGVLHRLKLMWFKVCFMHVMCVRCSYPKDFDRVFDKDILNASHFMTYVRTETAIVICNSGI